MNHPIDRRRALALAGAAAASAILPVAGARPAAAATPMLLGAQTHLAQGWDPAILDSAKAAALPISFIRDELWWRNVEQSPGAYTPEFYDAQVNAITSRGYRFLFTAFAPNPLYDGDKFPTSAAAQDAFAGYVAACVRRFGSAMVGVEVWNEPQGSFNYGVPVDDQFAVYYASLLQKTYQAVKAVRTDIPVSTAGAPGICGAWYQRLSDLGALQYCDAVAVHWYGADASIHAELKALRAIVGAKPIWMTEFGSGRAAATDSYRKLLAYAADVGVALASAYLLRDDQSFPDMGLLLSDGTLAPQGAAYKGMAPKLPLVRASTSTLAPCWRCADGSYLAWTDLGWKVNSGGALKSLPSPAFLTSPPTEPTTVVTDRPYSWLSAWGNYGQTSTGTKVTLTRGGYPFGTQLRGPGYLRVSAGTMEPTMADAAATYCLLPAAGNYQVLLSVEVPSPYGDGVRAELRLGGSPVWSQAVLPGGTVTVQHAISGAAQQAVELRLTSGASESYDAANVRMAVTR